MAVNPTAIWRVRPGGNNTNGGGYDPGIASPGTDYSQADSAHVTFDGTTITATTAGVGATITITGYTVAATDVANALHITGGTNFIAGWYYIQSVGAGTWTLDRNCTTGAGAAMTGSMGGGWADFWTNTTSAAAVIVPGNIVYILGSGTPNPASYTYDYTASKFTSVSGDTTNGYIQYLNDPSTPSYKAPPDTTGGMPVVRCADTVFDQPEYFRVSGLYFVASANTAGNNGALNPQGATGTSQAIGCVFDQFGFDTSFCGGYGLSVFGCEVFTSVTATLNIVCSGINIQGGMAISCNVHDLNVSGGIRLVGNGIVAFCVVAKCGSTGITKTGGGSGFFSIFNNTVDGNGEYGINIAAGVITASTSCFNNIISNHTAVGKAGLFISSGTAATNDRLRHFIDYNTFYNNTTNVSNIDYNTHDTIAASNPYTAQSTEDYKLA